MHKCGNYYNLPTHSPWLGTWVNNKTAMLHVYVHVHIHEHIHVHIHVYV